MWNPFTKNDTPSPAGREKIQDRIEEKDGRLLHYRWKPVDGKWMWVLKSSERVSEE